MPIGKMVIHLMGFDKECNFFQDTHPASLPTGNKVTEEHRMYLMNVPRFFFTLYHSKP